MSMKSLGTMAVLGFCLAVGAAESSSPSEAGSTVRGPLPGEFSEPGAAPSGPGATRRGSEDPTLSRPAEPGEKADRTANVRRKRKTDSNGKIYPGTSGKALDRDREKNQNERAKEDDDLRANRILVTRPHRSR